MNLVNSSKINSFGQAGANYGSDEKLSDVKPKDINNQSVSEIMNFINEKMNRDIQKKIRDVPEALPLIRRISHMNTNEDELFKKVRVGQQN